MWRADARRLQFEIADGQRILVRARLGLYERDGKFQLYAQTAEPAGVGADALALEQLRQKLAVEGLFDAARKRPLPALPRRIGLVTSIGGAAVRDVIRAVHRRFPVPILIADAQVQGTNAPYHLVHALREIARTDVDLVIIGRGGGSASDLSAFNHERVVRAVAACPVPTISAVGHEVDVTLTDLAADRRAATPSMAGEMAVPVLADLSGALQKEERRLCRELEMRLRGARQELDHCAEAVRARFEVGVSRRRRVLADAVARLEARHPRAQLVLHRAALRELENASRAKIRARLEAAGRQFAGLAGRLSALSPLRVLERGYAIAMSGEQVIVRADDVEVGREVTVRLSRGSLGCRVETVDDERD
jgi:exodeoxyribonuclease VII large subunit